ncbi:MAG: hypothetical protein LBD80_01300 [Tannerella sp.]|nr:hypothetical protein [Tannerella sp.]
MRSIIIMGMVYSLPATAQEYSPFSHLNVALRASTLGGGIELATPLNKHLKVRSGLDYFKYNVPYNNFSLSDDGGELYAAFGYVPDLRMKEEISFVHGHLLIDFHPVPKGIFHITAGAFVGTNRIHADGFLSDSNDDPAELKSGYEWPSIVTDGREIDFSEGKSKVDILSENTVKPYFGLGLGNAVTRHRIGFKFELGLLYQGDFSIEQNGQQIGTINGKGINNVDGFGEYIDLFKWWPVLGIQLTYRIF